MLEATFQLGPGLGPLRERALWDRGVTTWDELSRATEGLSAALREKLRRRIDVLAAARACDDVAGVAAALPSREHWRLTPWLLDRAAFLDIETCADGSITAIGIWRDQGAAIFLPNGCTRDRPLESFASALEGVALLVTYNGASFDLPVLRKRFPEWQPPPVHVDLCHLWRRLGHRGGLKELERAQGIERPHAIRSLDALAAAALWRDALRGEREALERFAAYNLADAAHLRPLLARGYNEMSTLLARPWPTLPVPSRGDMLYDLSRALLTISPPTTRRLERTYPVSQPTRLW